MKINFSQFKRFEKQIILKKIGLAGQKKISSASILIIGMGGLGCPLLTYLAASGVGKIGIVDFDKVEISNLNRQTLFNYKDIGKFKVNQAKKAIYKINKKIKIIPFKKKLTSKNIKKIFNNFSIICDGTDNYNTRYLINDYCVKNDIELAIGEIYDGSVDGSGHLTLDSADKNDVELFRKWLPTINSPTLLVVDNWLKNYNFDKKLHHRFRQYFKMLDSVRGTDFEKTFNPCWT